MTKESILSDHLDKYLLTIADISHGTDVVKVVIERAMDDYAKQESIGFLKWYWSKSIAFVHYLSQIKRLVRSDEIEEKLLEFEGQTFENLYTLYQNQKPNKEQP